MRPCSFTGRQTNLSFGRALGNAQCLQPRLKRGECDLALPGPSEQPYY